MGIMDLFKKKTSGNVAKDRLKLVLVSDRANCSSECRNSGRNLKGESGYLCAYSDDRGNPFFELIEFCCHCAL